MVQHQLICRSCCSVERRVEPGLGHCRTRCGCRSGIFQLESLLVQVRPAFLARGAHIEPRFESLNTLSRPQWSSVDQNNHDSNFGAITNDNGPRLLELGGKYVF